MAIHTQWATHQKLQGLATPMLFPAPLKARQFASIAVARLTAMTAERTAQKALSPGGA
jgi:hypothetical protein